MNGDDRLKEFLIVVASLGLGSVALGLGMIALDIYLKPSAVDAQKTNASVKRPQEEGIVALIGNTPLIKLKSLSKVLGCTVLGKCEFLNPGGSSKDRVALQMVRDAEASGALKPGGWLVEGTSGSTGVSLALLARALGYRCHISMPDDQAMEKQLLLRHFGAELQLVKPASIANPNHYVNTARRIAEALRDPSKARHLTEVHAQAEKSNKEKDEHHHLHAYGAGTEERSGISVAPLASPPPQSRELPHFASTIPHGEKQEEATTTAKAVPTSAIFCDQFETLSNAKCHYLHTGPEIWKQTDGSVTCFVMGSGTGGTIAGVGRYLKEQWSRAKVKGGRILLADPPGSSLFARVEYGVAFTREQQERTLKRHRYDTIIEGVGIDRLTRNFAAALPFIDGAFRVTDREAVEMSRYLLRHEGVFCGSSTAMNLCAVVKAARKHKFAEKDVVVTLLCDSGLRHLSRLWSSDFIDKMELTPKCDGGPEDLSFVKEEAADE
jgi:cysteine synthase